MDTEEGLIVEWKEGEAVVQLTGGLRCMTCAARGACQALGSGARQIRLPTQKPLEPGRRVVLRYPGRSRVLAAFLVFMLPLFGLIGGYAGAVALGAGQGLAVLGSLAGLTLGFAGLRLVDRILSRRPGRLLPELIA